jgi:hypothetical protein
MRVSTPVLLFGCLLAVSLGCAKSDGAGGTGGSGETGGSSATGGSSSTGGSTGTGGNNTGGSSATGGNGSGTGGIVSTGGSTGTGGRATGGSTGTGGRATGGSTGTGGSATGGSTGTGGSATGGSTGTGGTSTACTITPTASTSTKIPTVGIVTFTTTLASPTSASIKFGLDTNYGMTAPVDLKQTSYRTLLLGMKPSKTYHYQITVTSSSGSCSSADQMIATGARPNGTALPTLMVTTNNKAALWGGFLVIGSYQGGTNQSYILDADGDFVWWYATGSDGCGTRMSYDGQYMWINNANVPDQATHVHRVTMDGLTDTDFSTPFAHLSHQITPLLDGSVAFYTTGSNGCDDIKLFPANGTPTSTATTVVNARTAHGGTNPCHLNNIEYSASDDTLVFSDLDNDVLTKVSKTTGATVWVLNGNTGGITSTFTGDLWSGGEHGFHLISATDILLFNNNDNGSSSQALELTLDLTGKKSTKKWSYVPSPAIKVQVLGDVQRMSGNGPNGAGDGNTIVDFGTGDQVHEVDSKGTLLQSIKSANPFGFMEKRATLYGTSTRQ